MLQCGGQPALGHVDESHMGFGAFAKLWLSQQVETRRIFEVKNGIPVLLVELRGILSV